MQVGVNYPWRDYGWDFGLAPPAWRHPEALPRWSEQIDAHLRHFRTLGISVVRWFILGDGLTCGSGGDAPTPDPSGQGWGFDPPPIGAECLEHFEILLQHFAEEGAAGSPPVQLLPVLIDFHFCKAGVPALDSGWVKGGRADVVADASKGRRFFDLVLEPLLRVSEMYRQTIYAWELINEPEWVTNGWDPHWWIPRPLDDAPMRAFIEEGLQRIRSAGFKPTVGFALFDTLRTSGIVADVNQFHHYPRGKRVLPPHPFDENHPVVLGEFATASTDRWPELPEWGQTPLNRLRTADARGYTLALPWSFLAADRHSAWSVDAERDLECFTQGRHCPEQSVESPADR